MPRASNIYIALSARGDVLFASTVKYELAYWFERLHSTARQYITVVRMRDGQSHMDCPQTFLTEKDILD